MNSKTHLGLIASVLFLVATSEARDTGCQCVAPAGNHTSVCHSDLSSSGPSSSTSVPRGELRLWRDNTGRYEFSGYLVSRKNDLVVLAAATGRQVTVAIKRLSVADQGYLAGLKPHSAAELAEEFDGEVIEVRDGDTLSILVDGQQFEVSLQGIEAPELEQDCGPKSREKLARLVLGQEVHGRLSGNRQDSDRACQLWVKGNRTELSKLMLQSGLAWRSQLANSNREFQHAQIEAKMSRISVWAAADQVAPWEWHGLSELQRDQFREQLAAKTSLLLTKKSAKPQPVAKPRVASSTRRSRSSVRQQFYSHYFVMAQRTWSSYWLNTNSGVRHNPSCRWYGNTNSGDYRGANAGRACKLCGGAP